MKIICDTKTALKSPRLGMWLADASMVLCAFFWGLGFVMMKNALAVYPTYWLIFSRFAGAAILMGVFFFRRIAAAKRRDIRGGVIIGLYLFLGMAFQTLGLNYTSAGKQAFLTASYVILVPFIIWIWRRVFPGRVTLAGALICFAGMGLLTSDVSGPLNVGDVLTVAAAFFFAAQIVMIAHYVKDGDPLVIVFVQLIAAALPSLCAALIFEGPLVPQGTKGLMEVLYSAVVSTFLCFIIQNVAQKYTPPAHASILLGLESVFGMLCGVVFLQEPFTLRMACGCALIFAAVLLVELRRE